MSGLGGPYSSPRSGEGDVGLEQGEGCESQHVAAITGMLVRMVCSSIGNASLSLPALPRCWLRFPTRSQDFSCCSLLGSHPVGEGERWREGCPAATGGWQEWGPRPRHREEQWHTFNSKLVKKATFFPFLTVKKKKMSGKLEKLLLWDGFTIFSALCRPAPAALAPRAR